MPMWDNIGDLQARSLLSKGNLTTRLFRATSDLNNTTYSYRLKRRVKDHGPEISNFHKTYFGS